MFNRKKSIWFFRCKRQLSWIYIIHITHNINSAFFVWNKNKIYLINLAFDILVLSSNLVNQRRVKQQHWVMIWFRILLVSLNICGYFFQGKSQFLSILGELKLLLNVFLVFQFFIMQIHVTLVLAVLELFVQPTTGPWQFVTANQDWFPTPTQLQDVLTILASLHLAVLEQTVLLTVLALLFVDVNQA